MFRCVYVLLTIAGLLACPFNCALKAAQTQSKVGVQATTCKCCKSKCFTGDTCETSPKPTNSSSDYPVDHEEDCSDCVCTAAADPATQRNVVPEIASAQQTVECVDDRLDWGNKPNSHPQYQATARLSSTVGLTLRIALHSFLI